MSKVKERRKIVAGESCSCPIMLTWGWNHRGYQLLTLCAIITVGSASERVVNGTDAPRYKYGQMASLQGKASGKHFCGGSILSRDWVLTAAHCSSAHISLVRVIVGAHNISEIDQGQQNLSLAQIITHEKFNLAKGFKNDVALLQVVPAIRFNNHVYPSNFLPCKCMEQPGSSWLAGWGRVKPLGKRADVLQEVEETILSHEECLQKWPPGFDSFTLEKISLCTEDILKGACNGDSGGPLFVRRNDEFYQVGLVSAGSGGSELCGNQIVLFPRLSYYAGWIRRRMNRCGGFLPFPELEFARRNSSQKLPSLSGEDLLSDV